MSAAALPVAIVGAGAVSAYGAQWSGLGRALLSGTQYIRPSQELAASHPGTRAAEIQSLPAPADQSERRARLLMSRSAVLATLATRAALTQAGFGAPRDDIGFYLGVGASGGAIDQLTAMLAASIEEYELSLDRFGDAGLRACNPLYAFQLMNNFTLCHSAILHGTSGPNAAFFSRGTGTVTALSEALHAIKDGECTRALAGAADSCVHPVTWAELCRDGYAAQGLVPGEAAGILALQAGAADALALIERCTIHSTRARSLAATLVDAAPTLAGMDGVIIAPWGAPPRAVLVEFIRQRYGLLPIIDVSAALGESLAATTALAWLAALDLITAGVMRCVLILTAGVDGELGVTVFTKEVVTCAAP